MKYLWLAIEYMPIDCVQSSEFYEVLLLMSLSVYVMINIIIIINTINIIVIILIYLPHK